MLLHMIAPTQCRISTYFPAPASTGYHNPHKNLNQTLLISNYRPISLTSNPLQSYGSHYCKQHNGNIYINMTLFFTFKMDFSQDSLSCKFQLIDDWMTALDNQTEIDAILLDFAKAFDKVPHKHLLSKLTSYGITGNTRKSITSFLSNRKQQVSKPCRTSQMLHLVSHRAQFGDLYSSCSCCISTASKKMFNRVSESLQMIA